MNEFRCIWCQQEVQVELSMISIFSFKKIEKVNTCKKCKQLFESINYSRACKHCSKPLETDSVCSDCLQWYSLYPKLRLRHKALFSYNTFAKEWMDRFKFQGDVRIAQMFSKEIQKILIPYTNTHIIVPIPLGEKSLESRGFNQVEVILDEANIPYRKLLVNYTHGKKQSSKTRQERLQTQQPFKVNEEQFAHIKNKKILIIDDVYTTGRTIYHAANCLKTHDINSVDSLSLFR